jgi:hypothetical protein
MGMHIDHGHGFFLHWLPGSLNPTGVCRKVRRLSLSGVSEDVPLLGKQRFQPIDYRSHAGGAAQITVDDDPYSAAISGIGGVSRSERPPAARIETPGHRPSPSPRDRIAADGSPAHAASHPCNPQAVEISHETFLYSQAQPLHLRQ